MDIKDGICLSGSASYYLSRGGSSGAESGGGGVGVGGGGPPIRGMPSGFKHHTNINVRGGGAVSSVFQVENHSGNIGHGISMGTASGTTSGDPVKKKRGRPRKYGPEGANMSLALSSMASPVSITPGPKRAKGRPPGSGWKQQLAPLGEWMNSSAGLAFTPYLLHIGVGEDISAKILAFAQQRPRAICILSANGTVSAVTLRPPGSSGSTVTYEGRFEMLSLSGSYLVAENGGPRNRTGGLCISICSPDGHVIGGAIGGRLIAASPVQVVVCSFVHGNMKAKGKTESGSANDGKDSTARSASGQDPAPSSAMAGWPSSSRADITTFPTGIDLMRG